MPRKVDLDAIVPGPPDEVAARLEGETRWSPTPYRGGVFTLGKKPLKGRVGAGGFTVGLNRRDWWTMLQPTAHATLEPAATGTRIRGEVGMPGWLVWLLRGVVVGGIPAAVGVSTMALLAEGTPQATVIAAGFAAFALVVGVLGTGAHVHHADEQVDELQATVLEVAGRSGATEDSTELAEAMREAEGVGALGERLGEG